MKKKFWIAIDLDNVVFDFEGDFVERIGGNNRHLYSLEQRYPGIRKDIIEEYVNHPGTYERLVPVFGTVPWLEDVQSRGFGIILITSRPTNCQEVTRYQVKNWNVPHDKLIFAKDKGEYLSNHQNCVTLVDDLPQNLQNLPKWVNGVIFDRPWNKDVELPRCKYNNDKMRMEIKLVISSEWRPF